MVDRLVLIVLPVAVDIASSSSASSLIPFIGFGRRSGFRFGPTLPRRRDVLRVVLIDEEDAVVADEDGNIVDFDLIVVLGFFLVTILSCFLVVEFLRGVGFRPPLLPPRSPPPQRRGFLDATVGKMGGRRRRSIHRPLPDADVDAAVATVARIPSSVLSHTVSFFVRPFATCSCCFVLLAVSSFTC